MPRIFYSAIGQLGQLLLLFWKTPASPESQTPEMGFSGNCLVGWTGFSFRAYARAVAGVLLLSVFIAWVLSLYDRHHESHCAKG